jgi:membrane associated rhomboid family serine protease
MSVTDDLRMQWRLGGMTVRLILVNVSVFVALVLLKVVLLPMAGSGSAAEVLRDTYVVQWLRSTADPAALLTRPWTVITYMFTHTGLGHIFWNMVLLWFGGRLFQDLLGGRRLLGYYLLSGLSGMALFMAVQWLMPGLHGAGHGLGIMGASASALGVFMGIAAYRPDMPIHLILIGPVKLVYVAAFFLLLDLVGIGSGDGVAHEAHIGGALFGIVASLQLKKGNDPAMGLMNLLDRAAGFFGRSNGRPRMNVAKRAQAGSRPMRSASQDLQSRIDAILDKISRSGYDSLTKEEKDLLFKASGRN